MAYIGTKPTIGNFQICDAISVVNGQAAYTMQVGGVNVSPQSSNHMIVSLNGTIQKPGGANPSFTVSGSTITFASNLATGDVIDFIQILGDVLDLGVPSDATVTAAKIGANAVTAAKLNNDIISGSTELASEPADTDEFLISDAGTLKRIDYSLIKGGGITMADQFRLTSNFTNNAQPISTNLERVDTVGHGSVSLFDKIGVGMTESSGIFTFPITGIYLVEFYCTHAEGGLDDATMYVEIHATPNNSNFTLMTRTYGSNRESEASTTVASAIIDVTDTTNVKVRFDVDNSNSSNFVRGSTTHNETHFNFIRLGDS
jgi:hypothetical protein